MFSIKDTLRKTIITTSALAVFATSFFTGCSQQPTVSDVDLYPPSPTAEVSTPYTEELTDDINPDINNETHDTEATLNSVAYAIYVNNIETGMTTTPDGMIEVSSVLPGYGVANYAPDEQALYLHTAAVSNLKLEFKTETDTITIEYSTGEKDENISTKEIILAGDMLKMSPEAVERYLGYDIEVYDDFINIVTDNKDIITPDSILPAEAESLADSTLNDKDTTKPIEQTHTTEPQPEPVHTEEVVTVIPSEPSTPSVSEKPDLSDHKKTPGGAYEVTKKEWDYFASHIDEIPDGGIIYDGQHRLNPAEAARINQEAQDIMDGKKDVDLSEGLSDEEIADFMSEW